MEEKPDILREKWACWAAEVSVTATSSVNPARMASLANFSGSLLIWTTCLCLPISQTYNNKIRTNSQPMAAQNISQYTQKTAILILYDNSYPHKPNCHRNIPDKECKIVVHFWAGGGSRFPLHSLTTRGRANLLLRRDNTGTGTMKKRQKMCQCTSCHCH